MRQPRLVLDTNVLVAAIAVEADWLVTENVRDFPESSLGRFDVLCVDASEALVMLSAGFPSEMPWIVDRIVRSLRHPPMDTREWLERLARRHAVGAAAIGKAIGIER